jgi:glycosyltransferase involved in cell wall biosynthesis
MPVTEQAVTPRGGGSGITGVPADYRMISADLAITPTVSVVVPAKNEARNLSHVFESIPAWVNEIVLVDGHSTDETVAVARQLCPDVKIVHQVGRGKGDALQAGFKACTGEIIVMIDADGSTDGAEIARFVGALVTGADYVKGSRFAAGGGSDDITFARSCGNWVLSTIVNRLFGTRYTDLCYGYNAFWARHLSALSVDCEGFEVETVMNIRAAKAKLRVHEVPSHEHSRMYGESNLRVIRDGWRIVKVIIRERLLSRQRTQKDHARKPVSELQTSSLASGRVVDGYLDRSLRKGTKVP